MGKATEFNFSLSVSGEKELLRRLNKFEFTVRKKIVRNMLTIGVNPIVKLAKKLAPVGTGLKPSGAARPHLKETILKRVKFYRNTGITNATIGTDAKVAPHGHLVLAGTAPHSIPGRPILNLGLAVIRGTIKHPGAKENQFLERAATRAAPQAKSKMRSQLAKRIEAEARKLARL